MSKRGVVLQAKGELFGDRVFFCENGRRHWLKSSTDLERLGFRWPDDVQQVPESILRQFVNAGHVPSVVSGVPISEAAISDSVSMREYCGGHLVGRGLEIGAGSSPFPTPLDCRTYFADRFSHLSLVQHRYGAQGAEDIVVPDIQTRFDTLEGVGDDAYDYVIGCHVIEHASDPIGAIVSSHRVIRPGGYLILVVPDKRYTFDRDRPLTSIEHLVLDHRAPDPKLDYQHYEEFYKLAFKTAEDDYRRTVDDAFNSKGDIHFHVWDYDSFSQLIEFVTQEVVPWSEVWSHAPMDGASDNEFYFRLRK